MHDLLKASSTKVEGTKGDSKLSGIFNCRKFCTFFTRPKGLRNLAKKIPRIYGKSKHEVATILHAEIRRFSREQYTFLCLVLKLDQRAGKMRSKYHAVKISRNLFPKLAPQPLIFGKDLGATCHGSLKTNFGLPEDTFRKSQEISELGQRYL